METPVQALADRNLMAMLSLATRAADADSLLKQLGNNILNIT